MIEKVECAPVLENQQYIKAVAMDLNKLKSLKVVKWRMKVERWMMKLERWRMKVESWRMNVERWRMKVEGGFQDGQTNRWTDICDCIVAFAIENEVLTQSMTTILKSVY